MPPEPVAAGTRDGLALLMAARRDDLAAVTVLLQGWDLQQTRDVAVFTAFFAAMTLRGNEAGHTAPGFTNEALSQVALSLALASAASPQHPGHP